MVFKKPELIRPVTIDEASQQLGWYSSKLEPRLDIPSDFDPYEIKGAYRNELLHVSAVAILHSLLNLEQQMLTYELQVVICLWSDSWTSYFHQQALVQKFIRLRKHNPYLKKINSTSLRPSNENVFFRFAPYQTE